MLASSVCPHSVRLRGGSAVRNGRGTSLPRVPLLRRCASASAPDAPDAPKQQPPKATPKTGLVSIAGNLHLRINAINVTVHLTGSNPIQACQQGLATRVQSAVMHHMDAVVDAATVAPTPSAVVDAATVAPTPSAVVDAATVAPTQEPVPIAPASPRGTVPQGDSPFTCTGKVESFDHEVDALVMGSDGHHLICASDCEVALRKPGLRVVVDTSEFGYIQSVAASADCRRVIIGVDNGLWLWDVGQGKVTALLQEDSEEDEQDRDVWSVAITPDGRYGVSGGFNQGLRVWDLDKRECIGSVANNGVALEVVISPDGQTAAAVVKTSDDSEDGSGADWREMWRWHAGSGFSKPVKLQGCPQGLKFSMSADGGVVLSVDAEGVVQRWDGQSGTAQELFSVQTHTASCLQLALSPDGRRAVLGNEEGVLLVWDVEGRACLAARRGRMCRPVNRLAISADGRYAVSYSYRDSSLHIWHLG